MASILVGKIDNALLIKLKFIMEKILNSSREDWKIHQKALTALAHYYLHKDSMPLVRVITSLPNSNRRVAMVEWIRAFSVLGWDQKRKTLVRKKVPEQQDLDGATKTPFWIFKVKQEQRRHISGNTFDSELFFERVFNEIQENIDRLSTFKLELAISELQKITANKRANDSTKN